MSYPKCSYCITPILSLLFSGSKKGVKRGYVLNEEFYVGGGGETNKKVAWVKWSQVCWPRELGGLGVKDLDLFNKALIGKWRWRLFHDRGGLWRSVLWARYATDVNTGCFEAPHSASPWWKDLFNMCFGDRDVCWFDMNLCRKV